MNVFCRRKKSIVIFFTIDAGNNFHFVASTRFFMLDAIFQMASALVFRLLCCDLVGRLCEVCSYRYYPSDVPKENMGRGEV